MSTTGTTIVTIEANNDKHCLQKPIKKFPLRNISQFDSLPGYSQKLIDFFWSRTNEKSIISLIYTQKVISIRFKSLFVLASGL